MDIAAVGDSGGPTAPTSPGISEEGKDDSFSDGSGQNDTDDTNSRNSGFGGSGTGITPEDPPLESGSDNQDWFGWCGTPSLTPPLAVVMRVGLWGGLA